METYENYSTWVVSRILSRSIANGDCFEYQGNWKHAYGLISITIDGHRQSLPAHRAMYMATNGTFALPRNVFIRHKCDNPRCVNIKHLEAGTPKDNIADMIERGRRAKTHRLHTRQCKLSDDTIREIKNSKLKNKDIARLYNITPGYVSKLRLGNAKTLIT